MSWGPPLTYRRSCVPLALAALLDRPVGDVAARLWEAGTARRSGAPGGTPTYGTDVRGATELALRLGHRVQWWNPNGELFLDARDFTEFLAARAHLRATTVRRGPQNETRPGPDPDPAELIVRMPGETPPEPGTDRLLTLREWRSRFPFGRWLVVVLNPPDGSHALALHDAEIVAGGSRYLDYTVASAYRILSDRRA